MKILVEGNGRKGWTRDDECVGERATGVPPSGCGALLRIEEADVVIRYVGGNAWENGDPVCCFQCPSCKQFTRMRPPPPATIFHAALQRQRK